MDKTPTYKPTAVMPDPDPASRWVDALATDGIYSKEYTSSRLRVEPTVTMAIKVLNKKNEKKV